jgi:hypothetical protein
MNKGIVMEMTDKSIIVMREDGKFDKISRQKRSCEIGEEIIYANPGLNWASPSVAGRSAIVAAAVFCLVLAASFAGRIGSSEVVAYVSLDINPSVEMGIDEKEQVLELRGLNNDGTELIQTVNFKGKTLVNVTASLLDKAEQKSLAKGEADIVIASTVVQEKSAVNDTQIAEKLRQQVTDHIKLTHPGQTTSYQVEAFATPQEVREEANKNGISMGKYSVYLNAKSNGVAVTVDQLKQESIHQIVKNNVDIKSAVIQPDKVPTKDSIRKLVEEEKSGELDKKLEEKKKEQNIKDNGKNNTNSNPDPKKTVPTISNNNSSNNNSSNNSNSNNNNKNSNNSNNGNSNNNNSNNNNKNDDKKTSTPNTPTKPNTPNPVVQPSTTKPGAANSGSSRPVDNKSEDVKKKVEDIKKDDSSKKTNDEINREEAKRLEDQKKREEEQKKLDDQKKIDDLKKEQDKKASEDDKKKNDSQRSDDQSKGNGSKKDDNSKNNDNSKKDDSTKK